MARETYVWRDGKVIPKADASARRADGPYVISDTMDATVNHADGQLYDSKRAFERAVRRSGCEIVGNDKSALERRPEFRPSVTGADIKQAMEQLRSGQGGR